MSLLIGLLTIALHCAIAAIVVYLIIWIAEKFGHPLPDMVQKLLWLIVLIVAVIGLVRLLGGMTLLA